MRKRLTVLFATMLCVFGLMLAACGTAEEEKSDTEATEAAQEEAAPEEEEEEKPDPSEKFVGEWLLAAMTSEGMTIVGDFQSMSTKEDDMMLVIRDDGTATLRFDESVTDAVWTMEDDDTMLLSDPDAKAKADGDDEDDDDDDDTDGEDVDDAEDIIDELDEGFFGSSGTREAAYKDGYIVIFYESDDFTGDLTFSSDGTMKEMPVIAMSDTVDFKSANQLTGEWKMAAMVTNGITMYSEDGQFGEEEASIDPSLIVNDDGTLHFIGMDLNWVVDDDGAYIPAGEGRIPIKLMHGMAVIDISEAFGQGELLLAYKK